MTGLVPPVSVPGSGTHVLDVALMFGFFGFFLALALIIVFARHRGRKIRLLEEAIRSGAMDSGSARELLASFIGNRHRVPWLYRVGWFGLFIAGGMLAIGQPAWWAWNIDVSWTATWVLALAISLAAVTMPFAVRELQARRHGVESGPQHYGRTD